MQRFLLDRCARNCERLGKRADYTSIVVQGIVIPASMKYAMRGTLPNYAKLRLFAKSILIYVDIRGMNDAGFC
jgi:hypothetical protein